MIRDDVLHLLQQSQPGFISGQAISQRLGVTRAAVWKVIHQLEAEGCQIESYPRRGYRLLQDADRLTAELLAPGLKTRVIGQQLIYHPSLDSTSRLARDLAADGAPDGTVVLTDRQTAPQGRRGGDWQAPAGQDILLSVLLRPPRTVLPGQLPQLTLLACAAAGQALLPLLPRLTVGWPGELYAGGKKFCGILTQTQSELDQVDYVILGIGIHLLEQETAAGLTSVARAAAPGTLIQRLPIAQALLQNLDHGYNVWRASGQLTAATAFCRQHMTIWGQTLRLQQGLRQWTGQARTLDEQGRLLIQHEDGQMEALQPSGLSWQPLSPPAAAVNQPADC
ncbi:biotin--[acetyl-CoA-carboxylase] ligase [Oscillospiraceae bacterium HV4-5-C5C]|nr:biotin--[acetyl-CoA-carboxylase] ligase [Oscillospiraceae bacterium HV4-5-C5C]